MPQSFTTLFGSDTLKASRAVINDNDSALASNFSGTAPPASPAPGWTWYETDQLKLWGCLTSTPTVTWKLIADFNKSAIFKEDADAAYAAINHLHPGVYSPVGHNHDGVYSPSGHNHAGVYSPVGHDHAGVYAPLNHSHAYAPLGHEHSYAAIGHNHYGDIHTANYALAVMLNSVFPIGFCIVPNILGTGFSWAPPLGTQWESYTVEDVKVRNSGGTLVATSFAVLRRIA